ncbi:hypothetical protein [Spirosoma aerophilum]
MKKQLGFLLLVSGFAMGQPSSQPHKPDYNYTTKVAAQPASKNPTAPTTKQVYGPIPVSPDWIYVQDYSSQNTRGFVDGSVTVEFSLGQGSGIVPKSTITVAFPKSMSVVLDSVNYGDGAGSGSTMQAWTRNVTTGAKEAAFPFVGPSYNRIQRNKFTTPRRTDYYEFQRTYPMPTELYFYGWYYPYQSTPYTIPQVPIQNHFGAVTYQWNFQFDSGRGLDNNKLAVADAAQIYRNYIDFSLVSRTDGTYAFQPAATGGWKIDSVFAWQKRTGKINILCAKNNEPLPRYADLYAQLALRYGPNASFSSKLSKVYRGPSYPANDPRVGLNLVHYYQLGNEPNRWWSGKVGLGTIWTAEGHTTRYDSVARGQLPESAITSPGGMMTPWEIAFTSKIVADSIRKYDPNAHIILAGLATSHPGYIRAILQWCDLYNNGVCFFDGVSYHDYNNSAGMQNQSGVNVGVSPENTAYQARIIKFKQALKDLVPQKEISVWITETGYSIQNPVTGNQNNVAKTLPNRDRFQTQGDWSLRTALASLRCGLNGTMFYQLYDDSNFKYNPNAYLNWDLSCGIANESLTERGLRPTTEFFAQVNSFARDYVFSSTTTDANTGVIIDKLIKTGAKPIYVVTKPSEDGSTAAVTLSLSGVTSVRRYDLKTGQRTPVTSTLTVPGGKLKVTATETPTFFMELP